MEVSINHSPLTDNVGKESGTPADKHFQAVIDKSLRAVRESLGRWTPQMSELFYEWTSEYYNSNDLSEPFMHARAFPMLLFPWWFEQSITGKCDSSFQQDLITSTICGYQYIRIMDNVMDEHAEKETALLPATGFLHSCFQGIYYKYFSSEHPFWDHYNEIWFRSAEYTILDVQLKDITEDDFHTIAAQKTSAVKIPMAAVSHKYHGEDAYKEWCDFINLYGSYHQMYNDLFDWQKDLKNGSNTYLISEAVRRKKSDESETSWMIKSGLSWAAEKLNFWMKELKIRAASLNCRELEEYLLMREMFLKDKITHLENDLKKTAQLFEMLQKFGAKI